MDKSRTLEGIGCRSLGKEIGIVVLTLLAPDLVHAYQIEDCGSVTTRWASSTVNFTLDAAFVGDELKAIKEAFAFFNELPGVPVTATFTPGSVAPLLNDNKNSIIRASTMPPDVEDFAGIKVRSQSIAGSTCTKIVEADIYIDKNLNWNKAIRPLAEDSEHYLVLAMLHELGHAFGLSLPNHEELTLATMNPRKPHGGTISQYHYPQLHADDIAGLRALYGGNGSDLGATRRIFNADNASAAPGILSAPSVSAQAGGAPISHSFIAENSSSASKTMRVQWYLSMDDEIIEQTDQEVGGILLTLPPGKTTQLTASIGVPISVPPGLYTIGYWVDSLSEVNETQISNGELNNAIALAGKLNVGSPPPPPETPTCGNTFQYCQNQCVRVMVNWSPGGPTYVAQYEAQVRAGFDQFSPWYSGSLKNKLLAVDASVLYEVRVRAKNGSGASGWCYTSFLYNCGGQNPL